jgi:hypothetical protein
LTGILAHPMLVIKGEIWFDNLLVGGRGSKPILMRGLNADTAGRTKTLIEERVARASSPHPQKSSAARDTADLVRKLAELRDAGILTQEVFEAKKKALTTAEQGCR